jgi:hypothetical protein
MTAAVMSLFDSFILSPSSSLILKTNRNYKYSKAPIDSLPSLNNPYLSAFLEITTNLLKSTYEVCGIIQAIMKKSTNTYSKNSAICKINHQKIQDEY